MEWRLPTKTESTVKYAVTDSTGAVVSNAVVTLTITGSNGTVYLDTSLTWNAGNQDYEYVIPASTFTPPAGAGYIALIKVSVSGVQKLYKPIPLFIYDDKD